MEMRKSLWAGATAVAVLSSIAVWSAWSRFRVQHAAPLPHALTGDRERLDSPSGPLSFYSAAPGRHMQATPAPLLLIHSVNAAGSAYEMKPLFEHYSNVRPVYALDLPGFGFSDRSRRDYTPQLMTDAVVSLAQEIQRRHPEATSGIDAIALSLSCEFLARAAFDHPGLFSSIGLIAPTGFEGAPDSEARSDAEKDEPGGDAAGSWGVVSTLDRMPWAQPVYDLMTARASIRYFLQRAFGSDDVDPDLVDYCYLTSHRPGARHAPLAFIAGRPFSVRPMQVYRGLQLPVWMVHGTRGVFSDVRRKVELASRSNWTIQSFDSGAMPQFELMDDLAASYDRFLVAAGAGGKTLRAGRSKAIPDVDSWAHPSRS